MPLAGSDSNKLSVIDVSKTSPGLTLTSSIVTHITPPSLLLQNSNHSSTQSVPPPSTMTPSPSIELSPLETDHQTSHHAPDAAQLTTPDIIEENYHNNGNLAVSESNESQVS